MSRREKIEASPTFRLLFTPAPPPTGNRPAMVITASATRTRNLLAHRILNCSSEEHGYMRPVLSSPRTWEPHRYSSISLYFGQSSYPVTPFFSTLTIALSPTIYFFLLVLKRQLIRVWTGRMNNKKLYESSRIRRSQIYWLFLSHFVCLHRPSSSSSSSISDAKGCIPVVVVHTREYFIRHAIDVGCDPRKCKQRMNNGKTKPLRSSTHTESLWAITLPVKNIRSLCCLCYEAA